MAAPNQPAAAPRYDVHPGVAMMGKWLTELKGNSGRSLEEWLKHIRKSGPKTETAAREWLKSECGVGTNSC